MASIKQYATAKGKAWRVQYRSPDGKSRTKRGFRTKSEAQAWSDKNAVSIHDQDWIDPNAGKITVGEVGERWLAMQTHLKPSSEALAKQVWDGTVKPYWGPQQVMGVTRAEVQAWVSGMDKSPSWVRHAHNMLAQVLDLAVDEKRIRRNPARGVKLPRRSRGVKVYWTMEQLKAFAAECGEREDLILLLGTSGLRWGEAIALRPCDLDPLRGRIRVERNAAKVGNGVVLGTPKTHERRTVAVASHVMRMLVERASRIEPDALLWEAARGGWLKAPGHNSWFDGALKRAQAKDESMGRVTPHGLRHVAAGLLVNAGANVKAVQAQMGHASATMTLDTYSDLFDDGLDAVASALDDGFSDVVKLSSDEQVCRDEQGL